MSMVAAAASAPAGCSHDLLVVGPGVLGSYLGKMWAEAYPGSSVVGLTNTDASHTRLTAMGLTPATKATLGDKRFPYVLFSAPPSGSEDYVAEVAAAVQQHWDGTGSFVFTGSMSVCAADQGEQVTDEDCPLVPLGKGPSTDRLLGAEKAVLEAGGNVVRLVGLYHSSRGAHTYFLKVKEVPRSGKYVVNLCHYEDAAGISMKILQGDKSGAAFRGQVFIGCDNNPTSFEDMIVACNKSPLESLHGEVTWTAPDQPSKGKHVYNNGTRERLGGWTPKFESFASFVTDGAAKDYYSESGLF